MTTTLLAIDIGARQRAVQGQGALGVLADALAADLEQLLAADQLPLPTDKAQLTRIGGRCPVHGTYLDFHPWRPHDHHCARCGRDYVAREHDLWWVMGAQLWTAERAVQAALLFALRRDLRHAALARRILDTMADRYLSWPNRDNALGPTRPFFSTYLESIWLLNLSQALALLEQAGAAINGGVVRDRLLEPSSALIASFHEGLSNRQVWNEAAILSAWRLLGRHAEVEQRLTSGASLPRLLAEGLLPDGTWYEGENYHLFAHRGLWYGVQLMRAAGVAIAPESLRRWREGFVTPFLGLLPDDTIPSRRDSQYRVSVRQWRFADWCELGLAETGDTRLAGLLARLYDDSHAAQRDVRFRSTADAERNEPPSRLDRTQLSWRALAFALESVPHAAPWSPTSVALPSQGLAVIRRARGQVAIGLESGATGGGHGHPDRLALTLYSEASRWLDDPGTGSYVDPSLHWYRSTLAHQAPLFDGASQRPVAALLTAFEDRGGAGWMQARADGIADGVVVTRTVVVGDGYLIDTLAWTAEREVTLTLPLCGDAEADGCANWTPTTRRGAGGTEDGFGFLSDVEACEQTSDPVRLDVHPMLASGGPVRRMSAWVAARHAPFRLWRAMAPGAPGEPPGRRHALETRAREGEVVTVWSWSDQEATNLPVVAVELPGQGQGRAIITTRDGTVATHEPAPHGWHVALAANGARSSIDLGGLVDTPPPSPADETPMTPSVVSVPRFSSSVPGHPGLANALPGAAQWTLHAPHYVGTEEQWGGVNTPSAQLQLGCTDEALVLRFDVITGHEPVLQQEDATNPFDNERADINADGWQLYLGTPDRWEQAWLVAPRVDGSCRIWPVLPTQSAPPVVEWRAREHGWQAICRWPRTAVSHRGRLFLDVVINERPRERQRRRGQLILSGGGGFGYLRGDRHPTGQGVWLQLSPDWCDGREW